MTTTSRPVAARQAHQKPATCLDGDRNGVFDGVAVLG
jgi:hypothetical protein